MNRIRIRLISIKVFLIFMIGIVPFCVTAQDVDGSEDHPLITRYEGSNIIYYHQISYDEYFIPLGKINVGGYLEDGSREFSYDDGMHLEGKVTRIQYDAPEGRSTLEIFRNYESALQRAGFEILYSASGADLGDRRFGLLTYPMDAFAGGITARNIIPSAYLQSTESEQHYLAAKLERPGGDVYVALYLSQSIHKETAAIQLDVIETVPMEVDMVTATSLYEEMERTGRARVYGILFEVGCYEILPESDGIISEIALLLNEHPEISLYITGHTDDTGGFDFNMELSRQRANAVMQWLVENNNISEGRLHAVGVGPVSPISTNDTEEGRALNRRVELVRQLNAN